MLRVPFIRLKLVRERRVAVPDVPVDEPWIAATILQTLIGDADREHLLAVFLDASKMIVGLHTIAIGTLASATTTARETFKGAIVANAHSIILGHNHPSGEVEPSPSDVRFTRRLVLIGRFLDLPLIDHLVVTRDGFRSMKALGIIDAPGPIDAALGGTNDGAEVANIREFIGD